MQHVPTLSLSLKIIVLKKKKTASGSATCRFLLLDCVYLFSLMLFDEGDARSVYLWGILYIQYIPFFSHKQHPQNVLPFRSAEKLKRLRNN